MIKWNIKAEAMNGKKAYLFPFIAGFETREDAINYAKIARENENIKKLWIVKQQGTFKQQGI